jgi:hypothetical protein
MKKLLMMFLLVTLGVALTGCSMFGGDDEFIPNRYKLEDACQGEGNYIVVDGQCVLIDDVVNQRISINGSETIVDYLDSVEQMSDFVADLSGSTGLAVVSRDILESQTNAGGATRNDLIMLAAETEEENTTENLIVKLTEDGFFEEVSFSDDAGNEVNVTSNPLALEVFGDYTIVVFEVDLGYSDPMQDFTSKVWDSLYSGGIYLIHNESGKMFATKDVVYTENTYTYTEDHSRNIRVMVRLGEPVMEMVHEPVLDENGNPTYDQNGMEVYQEVERQVLDENGNPIIFNEGPIQTEIQEVPLVEYYEQEVLDENGDVVLDDNGNPMMEIVEEPVLDENGNPIIEQQEVPVLDENGDVVYVQEFEVELFIEDVVEITKTEYYAQVTDNPLSELAQRFVDQVIAEYYNWNYYRVNNYVISHWGFATSDNYIYYVQNKENETDPSKYEKFVMRMSFDDVNNELLLEEYINASKAGFDECEIIIDPRNDNIICDSWDANIKVYSSVNGLSTIPDSDQLNPVTFPNGELYFYDSQQTYVEELEYYTTLLYTIESDGTLTSHYIELGEREEVCVGDCVYGFNANFFDAEGVQYNDWDQWVNIDAANGEKLISSADLELESVGTIQTERAECEGEWCGYQIYNTFIDALGEIFATTETWIDKTQAGSTVPAYGYTYTLDGTETTEYALVWGTDPELCDNEIGCLDSLYLIDESINDDGLWIWYTPEEAVDQNTELVDRITVKEDSNAQYIYTKDVEGEVCPSDADYCEEYIPTYFYDIDGTSMNPQYVPERLYQIPGGETIPLRVEYHITANSTTTIAEDDSCRSSDGCWQSYQIDGNWLSAYYEFGDEIYETIELVSSDRTDVLSETLTSEVCQETWGCGRDVTYTISDPDGNVLYEITAWANANWGYRLPYQVNAVYDAEDDAASDVEITAQLESTQDVKVCEDTECVEWVEFVISTGIDWEWEYLGSTYMTFQENDQIIRRIILPENTEPTDQQDVQLCRNEDGCIFHTNNFIIQDELGNAIDTMDDSWSSVPVLFDFGDPIPNWDDNEFEATFTMTNVEYQTSRLNVYDFIWNLTNVIILDENLYLIERESWAQGQDNVILTFNETTNNYAAMYTNLSAVTEITKLGEGSYIAINDDETEIHKFEYNSTLSGDNYYYFEVTNMTEGLQINGVNDLIVDYDGSIYFKGVDNFIQDITGTIAEDGTVTLDTEYVERDVVRLRPIN